MDSPGRRPPSGALSPRGCFNYTPLSAQHATLYGDDRTVRHFRDDRLVGLGALSYPTVVLPHASREFPCDWELPMSKPNTRRTVVRAARIATGTGGICLLLSLPSTQAYAATGDQPSPLSGITGAVTGVLQTVTDPVTGALGSIVNSVTEPVTNTTGSAPSATSTTSQSSASGNEGSQSAPSASTRPSAQPTAPSGGEAAPTATATAPKPTATKPVSSPTGAATPTVSAAPATSTPATVRNIQPPTAIRSTTVPTSGVATTGVGSTTHRSAAGTRITTPEASKSAAASVPRTTEPAPAQPTPRQSHHPAADIASPLSGMPGWLIDVLLATGLLAAGAFATEPVIVLARRRRQRGHQ